GGAWPARGYGDPVGLENQRDYERDASAPDFSATPRQLLAAAGRGDAEAQNRLGVLYDRGQGVPQDFAEAAKWDRRAAEQGEAAAQPSLGVLYASGRGVGRVLVQALLGLTRAPARGLTAAARNRAIAPARMPPAQIERARALAVAWRPSARR